MYSRGFAILPFKLSLCLFLKVDRLVMQFLLPKTDRCVLPPYSVEVGILLNRIILVFLAVEDSLFFFIYISWFGSTRNRNILSRSSLLLLRQNFPFFFLFSSCFLWNCVSLLWYLQLSQICTSGTTSFAYLRSQLRDCLHYQLACPMSPLSGCSLNCNYVLERPWTYLANSLKRPIKENMLVVGC